MRYFFRFMDRTRTTSRANTQDELNDVSSRYLRCPVVGVEGVLVAVANLEAEAAPVVVVVAQQVVDLLHCPLPVLRSVDAQLGRSKGDEGCVRCITQRTIRPTISTRML